MNLIEELTRRVALRHMLDHPFYKRWSAGELTLDELREYARQYYHYTMAFPTFLSAIHHHVDDIAVRQAVLENLIEEERGPENHPELWLRFCDALGLTRSEVMNSSASDATRRLIDTMRSLARDGDTGEGLAALFAYESQIPAVAKAKIEGLARFHGIDDAEAIKFFTVHMEADVLHAQTSEELLTRLCATEEEKSRAATAADRTLEALYGFLDSVNRQEVLVN